ncbi:hypothetical protein ACR9PT_01495 [Piscirickettsia salmonis]|uniref:hypothetical protein n=1 Tax=Piscirickettsia salmonis TaxID=1238 RepID=UPI003EBDEE5F
MPSRKEYSKTKTKTYTTPDESFLIPEGSQTQTKLTTYGVRDTPYYKGPQDTDYEESQTYRPTRARSLSDGSRPTSPLLMLDEAFKAEPESTGCNCIIL